MVGRFYWAQIESRGRIFRLLLPDAKLRDPEPARMLLTALGSGERKPKIAFVFRTLIIAATFLGLGPTALMGWLCVFWRYVFGLGAGLSGLSTAQ